MLAGGPCISPYMRLSFQKQNGPEIALSLGQIFAPCRKQLPAEKIRAPLSTRPVVNDRSGLGIAVGFFGHRLHANDLAPTELDDDGSGGFSGFDEIGKSDEQLLGNIYFGAARGCCNVLRFCIGLRRKLIGLQSRRLALRVVPLGELNRSTRKIGSYIGHRHLHSLFSHSQTAIANLGVM